MLNENKGDDIITILKHLHQYIPQEDVEEEIYIATSHKEETHSPSAQAATWR